MATHALVPQDGRDEYVGQPPHRLRAGTTLLHARVNLSEARSSSAHDVFSLFFGLTLAHPCTVLLNHLLIDPERPTGIAVIYEYETHAELPLKPYGHRRYDEIYLPASPKQKLLDSMRVVRAYYIDRAVIDAAPVLAFSRGHDGREWEPRSSVPGRWRESALSARADGLAVRAAGDRPQCDADYLHMRQFWQKQGKLMPMHAQALQAVLSGSDASGPPRMQRHGFYIYDTQRRFAFDRPVRYRDEDPDVPRADMPYAVGIMVVFTGTAHYDETSGRTATPETRRFSPIRHQANLIGLAVERGYEGRVYPILDDLLANLPWTSGVDGPVLAHVTPADQARLPQWQTTLDIRGIPIELSM